MAGIVRATNARMEVLIGSLLTLAGSEAGVAEREPLDLADVVRVALDAEAGAAPGRRAHPRFAGSTAAPVHGDPLLLERLAANLVHNAVRYNATVGWVRVSHRPGAGRGAARRREPGPRSCPPTRRPGWSSRSAASRARARARPAAMASAWPSSARSRMPTAARVELVPRSEGGLVVTVALPAALGDDEARPVTGRRRCLIVHARGAFTKDLSPLGHRRRPSDPSRTGGDQSADPVDERRAAGGGAGARSGRVRRRRRRRTAGRRRRREAVGRAPGEGRQGGKRHRASTSGDVDYVDPGQTYYQFGYMVHYSVNRGLYSYKPGDVEKPSADLATGEPEISADRQTITVRMRPRRALRAAGRPRGDVRRRQVRLRARVQRQSVPSPYATIYFADIVGAPSAPTKRPPDITRHRDARRAHDRLQARAAVRRAHQPGAGDADLDAGARGVRQALRRQDAVDVRRLRRLHRPVHDPQRRRRQARRAQAGAAHRARAQPELGREDRLPARLPRRDHRRGGQRRRDGRDAPRAQRQRPDPGRRRDAGAACCSARSSARPSRSRSCRAASTGWCP